MTVTRLVIVAVGGQGNILAARVLGETAVTANMPVRMSEFHGMAQRGGVVESMILLGHGEGGCMPLDARLIREAIRARTKKVFAEITLKAFDLGMATAAAGA